MRRHLNNYWWIPGLLVASFFLLSTEATAQSTFTNPLGAGATVEVVIVRIINFLLGLVGVLALLSIIWGGVLYIVSLGNDNYVQMAKKIIFWAVVGLAVIILAFAILNTTARFLGSGV